MKSFWKLASVAESLWRKRRLETSLVDLSVDKKGIVKDLSKQDLRIGDGN
jgi:hypothetical protein